MKDENQEIIVLILFMYNELYIIHYLQLQ